MATATLTTSGRISIAARARRSARVQAGERVKLLQDDAGRFGRLAARRPVRELKSLFGRHARTVSIDGSSRAIRGRGAAAALRGGRTR